MRLRIEFKGLYEPESRPPRILTGEFEDRAHAVRLINSHNSVLWLKTRRLKDLKKGKR